MMISLLTITLFCLPSDAAEKMMLCTSILVALVFFMLLISKILPSTSLSIPLISKYLMFTFLMNLLTVFLSVLSLYMNHHRTCILMPVPYWVKVLFFHTLPTCLFLNKPYESSSSFRQRVSSSHSPLILRKRKSKQDDIPEEMNYLLEQLLEVSNDIKYLSKRIQDDTEETKVRKGLLIFQCFLFVYFCKKIYNEWKYVSLVLDRIHLFIFLIVTFVGTITMLFQIPKLFESHRDSSLTKAS